MSSLAFPNALSSTSGRDLEVLHLLGRLGVANADLLAALLFPDRHRATAYRALARLLAHDLVWRATLPGRLFAAPDPVRPDHPRKRSGIYGLTVDGKALLQQAGGEAGTVGGNLELLVARERRAPKPAEHTLYADLLRAIWCASVIEGARRCPMLTGVRCQVQVVTARAADGSAVQTVGALLGLQFNPQQRSYVRPGWHIPWNEGAALRERERSLRFALEVDTGQASTRALLQQAQTYAGVFQQGGYRQFLGGDPLPVLLVPTGEIRKHQVGRAWQEAWPQTPAVLTTTSAALHPDAGALGGGYIALADGKPVSLLAPLGLTLEGWSALIRDQR